MDASPPKELCILSIHKTNLFFALKTWSVIVSVMIWCNYDIRKFTQRFHLLLISSAFPKVVADNILICTDTHISDKTKMYRHHAPFMTCQTCGAHKIKFQMLLPINRLFQFLKEFLRILQEFSFCTNLMWLSHPTF